MFENGKILGLPAAAWAALLNFATWFLTLYFEGSPWVPATLTAISVVLKIVEVYGPAKPPAPPEGVLGAPMPAQGSAGSRLRRVLIGP